jgi:predicted membrane protein
MICNIMFWKLPSGYEQISKPSVIILGITVWLIYVLDRLLDNQKGALIFTERHLFHQSNQRILWLSVMICTCICAGLLFFIPFDIIKFGFAIALITGLYLLIVNKVSAENSFQHYKEPLTSFVYTAAVWGTASLHHFDFATIFIGVNCFSKFAPFLFF